MDGGHPDPFGSDQDRLAMLERYYVRPDRQVESVDGRPEYQTLMKELDRERRMIARKRTK